MTSAGESRPSEAGAARPGSVGSAESEEEAEDPHAYLTRVMAEIDDEVRRRRASGDLPARVERELDELFLEHSPVTSRGGELPQALRLVDAAVYIDPVVPIGSTKSGGAAVKRGLRSLSLWYVGYVTHQVSQFASAVSRSLHLVGDQLTDLRRQLDAQRVPPAPVVEVPSAHRRDAWWVRTAAEGLGGAPGRVLHGACGDGWLVRRLAAEGVDAYGIDPRRGRVDEAALDGTDLRQEAVSDHLRATEPAALGGVVLTGIVDGMGAGEREQLLELLSDRLAPDGTLVIHSCSPAAWGGDDLPPEADLAVGRPLRGATWPPVLAALGFDATLHPGPSGADYLVVAVLGRGPRSVG